MLKTALRTRLTLITADWYFFAHIKNFIKVHHLVSASAALLMFATNIPNTHDRDTKVQKLGNGHANFELQEMGYSTPLTMNQRIQNTQD